VARLGILRLCGQEEVLASRLSAALKLPGLCQCRSMARRREYAVSHVGGEGGGGGVGGGGGGRGGVRVFAGGGS